LIGDERIFLSYGCKIAHVSTPIELVSTPQKEKRNWLPLLVATAIVLSIAAAALLLNLRQTGSRSNEAVAPINAPLDPYAANLPLTGLAMSESANLAGGKVTYLDGTIRTPARAPSPLSPCRCSSATRLRRSLRMKTSPSG